VHDTRARLERGARDRRTARIDRDRRRELRGERAHRAHEPLGLLGFADRGLEIGRARPGADIDERGALLHHPERGRHHSVDAAIDGAGVKGFGTDVDDAHDRDRRSVTERDTGEIGPGPARHVSRYHLNMGAPTWPPYPQRSSRPGEAAALLDMTQLRRSGRFGEWPRAQDARDLLGVQRLALEQGARERVQLLDVFLEDLPRARGAFEHDALDLAVDGEGGVLAVILRARDLATEEDVLLVLAEGERAQLLGHAPLAHHLARHLGGLLEVVAGTRRLLLQHDLLGAAAT